MNNEGEAVSLSSSWHLVVIFSFSMLCSSLRSPSRNSKTNFFQHRFRLSRYTRIVPYPFSALHMATNIVHDARHDWEFNPSTGMMVPAVQEPLPPLSSLNLPERTTYGGPQQRPQEATLPSIGAVPEGAVDDGPALPRPARGAAPFTAPRTAAPAFVPPAGYERFSMPQFEMQLPYPTPPYEGMPPLPHLRHGQLPADHNYQRRLNERQAQELRIQRPQQEDSRQHLRGELFMRAYYPLHPETERIIAGEVEKMVHERRSRHRTTQDLLERRNRVMQDCWAIIGRLDTLITTDNAALEKKMMEEWGQ